jgi:hypothetical protein
MTNTKTKITVAFIILFLAFAIFFAQTCFAQSNQDNAEIVVQYPLGGATISTDTLRLGFYIRTPAQYTQITTIDVHIFMDNQEYKQTQINPGSINNERTLHCEFMLEGLSSLNQGAHEIKVETTLNYPSYMSQFFPASIYSSIVANSTVTYYLNHGIAPEVTILSSDKYATNQPTLNLTTNDASTIFSYSLDNNANITIPYQHINQYNLTLTELTNGKHNINVYGMDMFGNVGVTEKTFTVNIQNHQAQPTFSALAVFVGGIIAGIALASLVALIFYRKTTGNPQK